MRVCGIIAEYNPFHSGHAYQLQAAREKSGCDYLIVAMSGDFVQRGAPAMLDKYVRARMALLAGADLVLMLPVYASTASAEGFARGGIALLNSCGVVDTISFGCEDPSICSEPYRRLAQELFDEPEVFQKKLHEGLGSGLSYGTARSQALDLYGSEECDLSLLNQPNNLLTFEYLRAMAAFHTPFGLCPVKRSGDFLCASQIRQRLVQDPTSLQQLCEESQLPAFTAGLLHDYLDTYALLSQQELSAQLHYALLMGEADGFEKYPDCSFDLSARIRRLLDSYQDFDSFCDLVKNKSLTRARIARALIHILLQLPAHPDTPLIDSAAHLPYLRVLGMRRSAAPLLHEIKLHGSAPLITRPAMLRDMEKLDSIGALQLYSHQDLLAADIYRSALLHTCGHCPANDYQRKIEIL